MRPDDCVAPGRRALAPASNVDTDSRSGDSYPDTSPGPGEQNIPS